MLEEIYITKNKFFDKHDVFKNILAPLVGEGLIFDRSDARWAAKRKVLSGAFYKDKLIKMTALMK